MNLPLLIKNGRVIDPSQNIDIKADLFIKQGKIRSINPGNIMEDHLVMYADGMVVCPGFIDLHCHLRQPGFEYKETIATGTEAAAIGGFTTICCMPNTMPPIDNRNVVNFIKLTAAGEGTVRVLPIGCITEGREGKNLSNMEELAKVGVVAFSDDGNPVQNSALMRQALETSSSLNLPIIEHCEDLGLSKYGVMNEGRLSSSIGLKGIPNAAEEKAIEHNVVLSDLTDARLHIAHISTAGSLEIIRRAKGKGITVTAEVTPHHLTLTEEWIMKPIPYNTNAKVNPPLRTERDIKALVGGLRDGTIDAIATDHAPHGIRDKFCHYNSAAFGISGLETALGSLMTMVHSGELDLKILISKLTIEPARILDINKLGTLQLDTVGDVVIFDPNKEWIVDSDNFASLGKNTPLQGIVLKGKIMATIFGGQVVYRAQGFTLEDIKYNKEAGR
ncbi:MAG: dihydroorotase [Chloroflexi bacterium]|nr:dihydroorotase [Chloroflexota bacterium]